LEINSACYGKFTGFAHQLQITELHALPFQTSRTSLAEILLKASEKGNISMVETLLMDATVEEINRADRVSICQNAACDLCAVWES
jgi:hypothetical protein